MNSIFDEKEQRVIDRALKIINKKILNREVSLTSPQLVRDYLRLQLEGKYDEHFGVILLDSQNSVIASEIVSVGTIDAAAVYPRRVLKACLAVNAASVIVYHNHPSGRPEPSYADERITKRLQEALELVDIRVLDHLIVGSCRIYSFAENGKI